MRSWIALLGLSAGIAPVAAGQTVTIDTTTRAYRAHAPQIDSLAHYLARLAQ